VLDPKVSCCLQVIFAICAACGVGITFLAPYCPEHNAVEWGIGWVKHEVLEDEAASQANMVREVISACRRMSPAVALAYIQNAGY
jgi:transposase